MRSKSLGFTFLELMVTVSMTVVLLTLSTVNYRTATKRMELILAAQEMAGQLRQQETNAASAKEQGGVAKNNIWGAYFSSIASANQKYTLFVDKDSNGKFDTGENYSTIKLPDKVTIKSIGCCVLNNTTTNLSVTYTPPDPIVSTTPNAVGDLIACKSEVCITLYDDYNKSTQRVLVNSFGLVDVIR